MNERDECLFEEYREMLGLCAQLQVLLDHAEHTERMLPKRQINQLLEIVREQFIIACDVLAKRKG